MEFAQIIDCLYFSIGRKLRLREDFGDIECFQERFFGIVIFIAFLRNDFVVSLIAAKQKIIPQGFKDFLSFLRSQIERFRFAGQLR